MEEEADIIEGVGKFGGQELHCDSEGKPGAEVVGVRLVRVAVEEIPLAITHDFLFLNTFAKRGHHCEEVLVRQRGAYFVEVNHRFLK